MEDEDMACGDDVTIFLVKKSEVDETYREEKRRKQGDGQASEGEEDSTAQITCSRCTAIIVEA
jgi:hypothetical protein